jgi:hypothetical protein
VGAHCWGEGGEKMKRGRKEVEFVLTDKGKETSWFMSQLTKHKDDSLNKRIKRGIIAGVIVLLVVMFLSMKGLL